MYSSLSHPPVLLFHYLCGICHIQECYDLEFSVMISLFNRILGILLVSCVSNCVKNQSFACLFELFYQSGLKDLCEAEFG